MCSNCSPDVKPIIILVDSFQNWFYTSAVQSFRQRIYPTPEQQTYLRREFGACRFVYNWALALRAKSWTESKTRLTSSTVGKQLTLLKTDKDHLWLNEASARSLFYALMNLDTAFSRFFNKTSKYPKFKCKQPYGGSAKFDIAQFKLKSGKLQLPKLKTLIRVNWTRELPCAPKFVTVSQDSCGDFWASFTCESSPPILPVVDQEVGIDLGISAFATLSTGEKIKAPALRRKTERVKILQRRAARKQKDSTNRRKAQRLVARAYRRVTNTRQDFQHKLSRRLVNENQVIALESLAVVNMVKNRKLSRKISEQGWTDFVTMLEYKAKWAGRTVTRVDRFFPSSKTCHGCGHVVSKLPLNIREWTCPQCAAVHDRDVNAAINILAAGRVVSACGADGRPMPGLRERAVGCEARRAK